MPVWDRLVRSVHGALVVTGVRHRENLVRAMRDGAKRAAGPDDVD